MTRLTRSRIGNRFVVAAALFAGVAVAVSAVAAQEPIEPGTWTGMQRIVSFNLDGSQLGVTIRDLEPGDSAAAGEGVKVDAVQPDSPAARAGLQPGDIVVAFDEERVRSVRQFSRLVHETPEGRTVGVDIVRDGQRQTVQVTPERRTAWLGVDGQLPRAMARRLRDLEPRLREELRARGPDIRQRLDEIERLLKELLERDKR